MFLEKKKKKLEFGFVPKINSYDKTPVDRTLGIKKEEKMVLVEKLTQFAGETTIHGIGYIAQSSSSLTKRMLWLFLLTGALTYAGLQIKSVVECKKVFITVVCLHSRTWH